MIKPLTAGALIFFSVQTASAQTARCIPRAAAAEMAVSLVPALIDSAAAACAPHLPPGAYLGGGSRALAERLRADTAAVRPAAVAMVLSLTGQPEAAPGADQDLMVQTLVEGFTASLDPAQCRGTSEMLEALSPLPTANVSRAVAAALGVALASSGEDGPPICRE